DLHTPADGATEARLGFGGDPHPLTSGVLAETGCTPRATGIALLAFCTFRVFESTDDRDLVAVDDDLGVLGEPAVWQPTGEPGGRVAGIWLVRLLPAAGAAGPPPVYVMSSHDYMIT